MCPLRKYGAGIFKIPSTTGGKIRLLGLLAYSVATVIHPPAAALVSAIVKSVVTVVSGQ